MLGYYYFNKKLIYQQFAVESLQRQILEHQQVIDQQEYLLQQIFPSQVLQMKKERPSSHYPPPTTIPPSHLNQHSPSDEDYIPTHSTPMSFNLNSVLPMVGSLFNVLGGSRNDISNDTHYINLPNSTQKDDNLSDINIDDELSNELKELRSPTSNSHNILNKNINNDINNNIDDIDDDNDDDNNDDNNDSNNDNNDDDDDSNDSIS